MKKLALLFLALIASVAFAQGNTGQSTTGVSRGNGLRIPQYRTPGTGAQSYFVATTGSDANDCRSVSTPCLTIQGATNKIPKLLRDLTTVNIAAGSYAGFYVSGFTEDPSVQQTTGGLLFDGALVNSTLTTGTATGTATAGTAGSGATFGTLTDSGQTWTVNNLRGRILTITGGTGSGQIRVISSNTATAITVVGTWTAPTGSSTYVIQDNSVIITTSVSLPASPIAATSANFAGIYIAGNQISVRSSSMVFRNIAVANGTGRNIVINTNNSDIAFVQMQLTTATLGAIVAGSGVPAGTVAVNTCYLDAPNTTAAVVTTAGPMALTSSNSLYSDGIGLAIGAGSKINFGTSEILSATTNGIQITGATNTLPNASLGIATSRISCASSAGVGISIGGNPTVAFPSFPSSIASIVTTDITVCGVGVQVAGISTAAVTSLSGTAATTALDARLGGIIQFTSATTITGTTQDLNVEQGGYTGNLASVPTGTCASVPGYGSGICQQ